MSLVENENKALISRTKSKYCRNEQVFIKICFIMFFLLVDWIQIDWYWSCCRPLELCHVYKANIRVPTDTLMTPGADYSTVNTLFTHINMSVENHSAFDATSKKIAGVVNESATQCEYEASCEEGQMAILNGAVFTELGLIPTSVRYDGIWSKRSYKHSYNSLIGGGIAIGKYSEKVLDHES